MEFIPPGANDWRLFLTWAAGENWQVPERERLLFQTIWRRYFFVLQAAGATKGFVSAVPYPDSGWIGNLLIDPGQRGRGNGAALFDFAFESLQLRKLKRVWLTASQTGLPIYQRRGLVSVDRVDRWLGKGLGREELQRRKMMADLIDLDQSCWGESREPLLKAIGDGEICCCGDSIGLLQPGIFGWQLGPWLSPNNCPRENRLLLTEALGKTPAGRPILIDVLASGEAGQLLSNAGLVRIGSNELMCWSRESETNLSGVMALASLGSIG